MRNFSILSDALIFIEESLCEPITQEDIAKACFCSLSSLQKLFRYAFHFSIKEYLSKRRLTNAAQDIIRSELSITEIAMKYQYNSPEVFSRAFAKLWETTPSTFQNQWKFSGLFPKIVDFDYIGMNEGGLVMKRKVDISEIYDVLKSLTGTYVLCFDVVGLLPINNISRELGDKVILEAVRRIDTVAREDMLVFRIGGDEFALVTGLSDIEEVKTLAHEVLALNGNKITLREYEQSVSVRAGAIKMKNTNLRYSELYTDMQDTINSSRNDLTEIFVME